ncbi:NAD(P)/FAD-dependent oxidoreductase [Pseudomonas typographi]|uniref:NAD(P)/FAD-dependent oxidoreductase n=1 Tax=Pseudomonas typographi TaxID=2715964 RepID=UPI001682C127|nr:FAD-binding oxidoreductase [Pseudomonas typographi]MBD1554568.1 FAD-binding oxidoreductase [Pseudomonas typographi]
MRFSAFDTSLWFATAVAPVATPALNERLEADVCVVGGGYTGLATALELACRGLNVVLLEAEEIGFGGSGRNAGHCTPTFHHHSIPQIRQMLGPVYGERLIARQTGANAVVAQYIARYNIDCEWQQNGYLMAAHTPSAMARLALKTEEYNAVGQRTRLLDRDEACALTGSQRFHGGWFHPAAGHLNPLGYARGLARAVVQEGGRVFSRSAVCNVARQGGRWQVNTSNGSVLADKVIFATGAYSRLGWPGLDQTFRIQKVFVAATEPLPVSVRQQVLPLNTTTHDGRGDIFVYKYNAEGRIVASMFPMGRRGRDMAFTHQVMSERLHWLHPQIAKSVRWDYFWMGELDMQRKTIPRLYGLAPGVVALTGLAGRGVPTGSMLGGILADWATDVPAAELALNIEPIRAAPAYMSVAPSLALRYYRWRDNRAARHDGVELPPYH